ncbi:MAG: CarD family transcriptional regulator, partial [Candidatus Peregrinibacteria bacterium]
MQPSLLLGEDTHRDLAQLLLAKRRLVLSGAANETAKALLTATILASAPHISLMVTENDAHAEELGHWLSFFDQSVHSLMPVENAEGEIISEALQSFLLFMRSAQTGVFLCSRATWDSTFPSYQELEERTIVLKKGTSVKFTQLVEDLIALGYQHGQDLFLSPGEYRRQGDVIDIHPIQSSHPYRIALSFDSVEKILAVDRADLSKVSDAGAELEIFPILYEKMVPLSGQLPMRSLLILDDQDDVDAPLKNSTLRFTPFPLGTENHAHVRYLSILKFYTLGDFLNDVRDKLSQEWSLFVVTKRLDELAAICREEHITCSAEADHRAGTLTLLHASEEDLLPHSLQNPDLKFALLTDREIFSLKRAGKQRSIQKLALDFITSLVPGDYVVHMEHGIGYFEGMTQKEIDLTMREYLELTYAEGDKLFVPVDQADKLSKYVYDEGNEPKLTRLGTQEWKRITEKMKEETRLIAKEL